MCWHNGSHWLFRWWIWDMSLASSAQFDAVEIVRDGARSTESTRRCFSEIRERWLHSAELPERRSQLTLTLSNWPVRGGTWAEHHEVTSHSHSENSAEAGRGLMSVPCFRFSISSSSRPWPRRGRSLRPPPQFCWGPLPGWSSPASASFSPSLNRGRWPLCPRFQDSSLRSPGKRQITGRSGSTTIITGNCVKIK